MLQSTKAIADLLGVSTGTVRNLARDGVIPAQRVGRQWRFDAERVMAALAPKDTPQTSTYEEGEE